MDTSWLIPLITIIGIDLVLAGDNAVIIGMASRNLPIEQRKKAIFWGATGAVIIRTLLTFIAVALLNIPYLMAIGAVLLLYVGAKLLVEEEHSEEIKSVTNLYQAIRTIIIADLVMGLDNVLAVAGASQGNVWLIFIGLAISIPIVIWGSQIIANLLNKYPVLIYVGAGIVAFTAGTMLTHDARVGVFIGPVMAWVIKIGAVFIVFGYGIIIQVIRSKSHNSVAKITHDKKGKNIVSQDVVIDKLK